MPNERVLIPIQQREDSEQWVDARTLHKFLEVGRDFSNWIKDYISDFGFIEGRDFTPNLAKSQGGRQAIEYSISLDMAKHLAMLQRSEKGMQARQYFINAEKQLRQLQAALLQGYDEVKALLMECTTTEDEGFTWYAAGQLRRLSGKSYSGNFQIKVKSPQLQGKAKKLAYRGNLCWFVREDAVQEILCVRPNQMVAVAMINLLQKGGIS